MAKSNDFNKGNIWLLKQDGTDSSNILNQRSDLSSDNKNYGFSIGYSEPLVKDLSVLFRYNFRVSTGGSDKNTRRFNDGTKEYDIIDSALTDAFTSKTVINYPDISLNYIKENKYRAALGFECNGYARKVLPCFRKIWISATPTSFQLPM